MTDPTPDDIETVVETINDQLPWSVTDWDHTNGKYETPQLTVELQWSPVSNLDGTGEIRREVLDHIDYLDDDTGAPEEIVIEDTLEHYEELTERQLNEILTVLKQEGEIYEPRTGHLRRT